MSTPFPLEDAANQDASAGYVDPWKGPAPTHWYSGLGFTEDTAYLGPFYRVLEGAGQGAAKGEALLAGLARPLMNADPGEPEGFLEEQQRMRNQDPAAQEAVASAIQQDAKDRVKAMTPDPTTTGSVAQTITGLVSGAYRATIGAAIAGPGGAAALLGGTEAQQRFQELKDKGVDTMTAFNMASLTGIEQGAGALVPMGMAGSLLKRVITGAAANVGFGVSSRYADHQILADAGYKDMADQQQVWDGALLATDGILGAFFGAAGHAHGGADAENARAVEETLTRAASAPGATDAALTLNLALRDRSISPGVAATPGAAGAHQRAMEQSLEALVKGEPVNVEGSGVEDGHPFVPRPANESPEATSLIHDVIASSGILDESQRLDDLEQALGRRLRGEPEPTPEEPVQTSSQELAAANDERTSNEPYLPTELETRAAGGTHTPEDADRVATVARAAELDHARVAALAAEHKGDADGFVEATQKLVDEHWAATPGGTTGAGEEEPAGGAAGEQPGAEPAGRGRSTADATAAGRSGGAAADAGPEGVAADRTASAVDPARQAVQENPGLTVASEHGGFENAATALQQADANVARAQSEAPGLFDTVATCASRYGAE